MDKGKKTKRIEIEWLCENAHLHSNYPFVSEDVDVDAFALGWLSENAICECGARPISYKVFEKGDIEYTMVTKNDDDKS